ncbi:CCA tRNA nucleotidyltransferase [Bacillus sp. 03113]|uniref:CCA tRNA nucleotidyltransferase n=1 Tax=Bacillus sp. 03113 TaxID=2578211 RepID=UPI001144A430|nr:CCA tRNA nucleotidyltransferase [Bacillus sp. 03113]
MNKAFINAIPLLKQIEDAGFEAYFVGGSIRDFLLKKEIADVDITTSATPEEVKGIFKKTIDIGIEHGTVAVIWDQTIYEITTFRKDAAYVDHRRPSEVSFIRSLYEDLKRRDFTMNAIAMNWKGEIIDPFHGQEAIKKMIIQAVGNPEERFSEDALRMMRAVRFVSQLGFTIDKRTSLALYTYGHLLEKIAVERKTVEFEKLLGGQDRIRAFKVLLNSEIYRFLPGLINQEKAINNLLKVKCTSLNVEEMWSLLLYLMEKINKEAARSFLREWKLPVQKMKRLQSILHWLVFRHQNRWTNQTLYEATLEIALSCERIFNVLQGVSCQIGNEELVEMFHRLPIKDRKDITVTGNDLIEWYHMTGGAWIKDLLNNVEKAILSGEIMNDREIIKEWLFKCNRK